MEHRGDGAPDKEKILYYKHISGDHRLLDFKFREVWRYRDLILLFVRRELVVNYKQTILGPIWIFISPLLTSLMHAFVFGKVAGISTDGIPVLLFYLFSNAAWTLLASCVNSCAETFTQNASIMSKVYFPRLVMPVSKLLSALLHFALQILPAFCLYLYYALKGAIHPSPGRLLLLPLPVIQMGLIGFGAGITVAALTTKYRDLRILVRFGVSLWMYASPVVYPLSALSGRALSLVSLNPASWPMELFRYSLWGKGSLTTGMAAASWTVTAVLAVSGIMLFNHVERVFADTV